MKIIDSTKLHHDLVSERYFAPARRFSVLYCLHYGVLQSTRDIAIHLLLRLRSFLLTETGSIEPLVKIPV